MATVQDGFSAAMSKLDALSSTTRHPARSSFASSSMANSNNHVKDERLSDQEDDTPLAQRKSRLKDEVDSKPVVVNNHIHLNSASKENNHNLSSPSSHHVKPELIGTQSSSNNVKRKAESDDEDEAPLASRVKRIKADSDDSFSESKPTNHSKHAKHKTKSKHIKQTDHVHHKKSSKGKSDVRTNSESPKKQKKEEEEVWRWWEEERHQDGIKWKTLEHKGPVFAPLYEPLPKDVRFYYDGDQMHLSEEAEEVATFYAKMLDHDYTQKELFNKNFFKDWRKVMTPEEKAKIVDLKKCNFKELHQYFLLKSEERKNKSKEDKQKLKEENEKLQKEYGFAVIDGHKEKVGNYKIEPPGLFRGRGDHPKMGMLKRRVMPEDIIVNCGKGSKVPEPPKGHKWKEVRHDNTVAWLSCWNENILGSTKYVMLNPSSKLKGEKDWEKYEKARKLKKYVDKIRNNYREDWKSKEMKVRQRAVALYFIDKLALRAGNEKEEGETADTVGCCSLRVEHIKLHEKYDDEEYVVEFDFLGKDSIRYYNRVSVEKRVFKNLKIFMEGKGPQDDLFDRLNTTILNKYLQTLMEGLTAKVFRTFNASFTLQQQLDELTKPEMTVAEKLLAYNRANRQVAILCNHQRAVPKTFEKSMENLKAKITEKQQQVHDAKKELKKAKSDHKHSKSDRTKKALEQKQKAFERMEEQLKKLELQATDKEENKDIALGTSKLNYLDPRISVAWCKKWGVPIEKIYSKTQRDKFRWAIDMATPEYHF